MAYFVFSKNGYDFIFIYRWTFARRITVNINKMELMQSYLKSSNTLLLTYITENSCE